MLQENKTISGLKTYFGGKGGEGVYQTIINCIRPHDVFISPFLGHCAVMRFKKPATRSVGLDLNPEVISLWQKMKIANLDLLCQNGITYLENLKLNNHEQTVIYCDPPYPRSSKKSHHHYKFDMTDKDHERLLRVIKKLDCDVLISTYENGLYKKGLRDWQLKKFQAKTRGRVATEFLYMNFDNSAGRLHDYNFLGDDFTERQRIKRKINRWLKRLQGLPKAEMNAILKTLQRGPHRQK